MTTKLPKLTTAVLLGAIALSGPAPAQGETDIQATSDQSENARERITLAGKLRMLSQRIPAAACHLAANVDPEGSRELLQSATAEFETIVNALEFGDTKLNINDPETRRKTLAKIQELRNAWQPFNVAANAMIGGDLADANLRIIFDQNLEILEASQHLATEISSEYFNPAELVHADSFLIDIADRQGMLTQKISKESCMLVALPRTPETEALLRDSMQVFATTMEALRHGMPSAGIRRPPTAEISTGLDSVLQDWVAIKQMLDVIVEGGELNAEESISKFHELNTLMAEMDEVVGMYAQATKVDR